MYDLKEIKAAVISGIDNESVMENILQWVRCGSPVSLHGIWFNRNDETCEEVATIYYEPMET